MWGIPIHNIFLILLIFLLFSIATVGLCVDIPLRLFEGFPEIECDYTQFNTQHNLDGGISADTQLLCAVNAWWLKIYSLNRVPKIIVGFSLQLVIFLVDFLLVCTSPIVFLNTFKLTKWYHWTHLAQVYRCYQIFSTKRLVYGSAIALFITSIGTTFAVSIKPLILDLDIAS